MIIRSGKATYDTDTNTFSFTFPTTEGEETVTLTNGKLRKAEDINLGQLTRYVYLYSSDSSDKARKAFLRHIYGLGAASRADAKFLAKYAVKALNMVFPLSDFNAVCCRTYHTDGFCRDLADEIVKHCGLDFLNEIDQTETADKILILDNRPKTFGSISELRLKYKESVFVLISAIPDIKETAYCGHTLIGCEGYITNPEKLPLAELIDHYAKEYKEDLTIVIPKYGDLDEAVREIVVERAINTALITHSLQPLLSSDVYEVCLYSGVFCHHYATQLNKALQQLWDYLHYEDLDEDVRGWETFFKPSLIQDEEMREVISKVLALSEEDAFKDCRLINFRNVMVIGDKTYHIYEKDRLCSYSPRSTTRIWV